MFADIMHVLFNPDGYLVAIQGGEIYLLPVEARQVPIAGDELRLVRSVRIS